MSEPTVPGLGDIFGLMGSTNPLAGIGKTIEQFKRGVNDFLDSVETFNATMKELNRVAHRVNGLLDEVEEPIRAITPQITRTVRAADAMVEQLSGPVEKVAPGLVRLADTLSSPTLTRMPNDLNEFLGTLREFSARLQPLIQLAESAGGMFGLRSLGVLRAGGGRPGTTSAAPAVTSTRPAGEPIGKTPAKKAATKKAPAKKTPAKKTPAKKAAAKKTAAARGSKRGA